jgi:predicted fused transcriptional regulator/phosphomethylpyrimidine kinase
LIILVLENSTVVKVRTLAKVCGKIIAMSPELGYVTQVMTRCIFSVLNLKDDWNQIININYLNDCIRELVFWKLNIFDFKPPSLLEKSYNFDILTDASDSGTAGFIQNTTFVMHKS